jgi:hypothetical protein
MAWNKPESGKTANYIKLEDGTNRVRIVSEPVEAYEHFITSADNKKSVVDCKGNHCNICTTGDKAKKKYHFAAISRNAQAKNAMVAKVELLTVGQTVYTALYDLMVSDDWKFDSVPDYDITITKRGTGLDTEYSVQPVPSKALSEADAEVVRTAPTIKAFVAERYGVNSTEKQFNQPTAPHKAPDIDDLGF